MPRKKQATPALPLADQLFEAVKRYTRAQVDLSWVGSQPPEERDGIHQAAAGEALVLVDLIAEVRALDTAQTASREAKAAVMKHLAPTRAPVRTKRKYTKRKPTSISKMFNPETES